MSRQQEKTSHILREISNYPSDEPTMSLGQFVRMLGDRGFCLAILVFSLPNSLPVPGIPGFSTITGLPIAFIGLQMMLGKKALWLPKKIAAKRFSRGGVNRLLTKALPSVIRLEKCLRPRWLFVTAPAGERVLGLGFIVLALVIALPVPGGNFLPGLSMSLLALGMLERDGIFVLGAVLFGTVSLVFMYEIIVLFVKTGLTALGIF